MKYYKVKPEADNRRRKDGNIYVANELYTERETKKLNLNKHFLEIVEIPKNATYWFFGARFSNIND